LTANNFEAYLETLRKVLFDCDLKLAPPRWLATQLMKRESDEFKAYVEEHIAIRLPTVQLKAIGGFGGYYTSDLDDFYTVSKLVQIQDRVISTSEKCPGSPETGTIRGNVVSLLGGTGTLNGDEIHWSSDENPGCFRMCRPALVPQVWFRQALTKEQVQAAETELKAHSVVLQEAEAELLRLRRIAEDTMQQHVDRFRSRVEQMLQTVQGELHAYLKDLQVSLRDSLEARYLDWKARIAQVDAEVARNRGELAGHREKVAVLEAKMLKAELHHFKGCAEGTERHRRSVQAPPSAWDFPFGLPDWQMWCAPCGTSSQCGKTCLCDQERYHEIRPADELHD